MDLQDSALVAAGTIGGIVAVIHGVIVRRMMVQPLQQSFLVDGQTAPSVKRLVPLLLDFSAFNWLFSGLALIVAAIWFGQEAKVAIALLVGSSYLFATIGNLWGTRGRHPGWMLYALTVILILIGIF